MPGKSEQSKKRKTSVKVQDMRRSKTRRPEKTQRQRQSRLSRYFNNTQNRQSVSRAVGPVTRVLYCGSANKSLNTQRSTRNAQRPIQKGCALASSVGESVSLHQLVGMQHWLRLPAMSRGNHHPIL